MVGWLRMFSIQGFLTWQSKLLMTYKHLSQAERYQIHALMKAGHDQSQIAKLLDRHKSTISRELSRNTGSCGYCPKQACEMSADRAISIFMPARRKAVRFGRIYAVRSIRGSAMQVAETGEDKSPKDGI